MFVSEPQYDIFSLNIMLDNVLVNEQKLFLNTNLLGVLYVVYILSIHRWVGIEITNAFKNMIKAEGLYTVDQKLSD